MAYSGRDDRSQRVFVVALLVSAFVLGFAYYLQHIKHLDPCPWCIVQRLGFFALGLVALIGLVHHPRRAGTVFYGVVGGVIGLAGTLAAGYHVWLQSDPKRASACVGSPVERVLDTLRVGDVWPDFLQYDGPCTLDPWELFGLNIPEWSLAWFVVLTAMYVSLVFRQQRY